MPYDANKHHRRSIRLRGWDYANVGAYFVTVVTHKRYTWFDTDTYRQIVENEWKNLPERFPTIALDEFVVMPNHLHFIVWLNPSPADTPVGTQLNCAPEPDCVPHHATTAPTLGQVVRVFKAVTSRRIRESGGDDFGWQRNYYERVIRNERELNAIREYIHNNPAHWAEDTENPNRQA